jgi:RimJ/RimL family protein N-acetyltransferase
MQYGIQRRTIYLVPPRDGELEWILDQFDKKEVWSMFGYEGPSRDRMVKSHREGNLVIGVIKRIETRRAIGFVVCFPPTDFLKAWEFGVVIPDEKERDLYSAMHASDAITHYMFDHCRIERGAWRIREDNAAPFALAKRMGYTPYATYDIGGSRYTFFRMNKERWEERYQRLEKGEDAHPSGFSDVFITLSDPPFEPEQPKA